MDLSSFGKLQTFPGYFCAYIIYDLHMNNIMIHYPLDVDINKEKNTKYGYQTDTFGDSDRQIRMVYAVEKKFTLKSI